MISGRFLKVLTNFNSLDSETLEDIINELGEGYAKIAWRENESILTGYLLVREGSIVGVIIEDILTNRRMLGEEGLPKILKAIKENKIHAVELYEAPIDEILREYPRSVISNFMIDQKIKGSDLKRILKVLRQYQGELEVQDDSIAWSLYVEKGLVEDAVTIKGPKLHGDRALQELLPRMGHIVKKGTLKFGKRRKPLPRDEVKRKTVFLDVLELLKDKLEFEKKPPTKTS
jgi:hypothetical protein